MHVPTIVDLHAFCLHAAESCARTAVRLEDMSQLLERLALEKVQDGDEDAARQVLKVTGFLIFYLCCLKQLDLCRAVDILLLKAFEDTRKRIMDIPRRCIIPCPNGSDRAEHIVCYFTYNVA